MNQLAVVVLAAGNGSRMKSSTHKLLHSLAGIPILGHVLATAESLAPNYLYVVVKHQKEQLVDYIAQRGSVCTVVEQGSGSGTAEAVQSAISALPTDFDGQILVLSGDAPLLELAQLQRLIDLHQASGSAATLLTAQLADPTGYGRIVREGNALAAIIEQSDADSEQLKITEVNAGGYVFNHSALVSQLPLIKSENAQVERYLTDSVKLLLQAGESVATLLVADSWTISGINDRAQLSDVAIELNRRLTRAWQLAGVTIENPDSVWIDIGAVIESDVTLLSGTRIHGNSWIQTGAVIGPDSTIQDSEIGPGAKIVRSDVVQTRVGADVQVGPYSHLRAGTQLADGSKVGAFVEIKNSQIGSGSKVPHLSYVGDAQIGTDCNIGAGTIFANYDGQAKHQTVVQSGAQLGSGSILVAPVNVGAGAYSAAGAVIRSDVTSGALVFSSNEQHEIADWVREKRKGSKAAIAAEQVEED